MALICERKRLSGKEFRFLRTELLLSQATLARVLDVKELTIGRWEKEQNPIPRSAETVVRMLFAESIGQGQPLKELLERIADQEDEQEMTLKLKETKEGWSLFEGKHAA
jgi:DNA-binding XRE family transcriptional regulator